MTVQIRTVGDVTLVELSGNVTIGKGELALRKAIGGLLDEGRSRIVIDLSSVGYVDSSGLGEMLASKRRAVQQGGDLKLLRPRAQMRRILEAAQLTQQLRIYDDESEAAASF